MLTKTEQPLGERIVRGGGWVILNRMVVAITHFVSLAVIARLLSPRDMGVYFIISNFVVVASIFVQFGLPQVAIKRTAESLELGHRDQVIGVVQACLLLGILSACVFMLSLAAGLGEWLALKVFDSALIASVLLPVSIWVAVQAVQRVVGEAFRGLHDLRMAAIFGGMVSGLISTSLLIAIAIFNGSCSLEHVVLVFLFAMSLSFLSALFLLHRKIGLFAKFAALELRPILMLVLPFLFANLGNIVLTRADIWILGMYVGDADVALYGAAARIVMLLNTPLIISAALLAGTIAQLNHRGDKAKLQQVVQLVPTVLTAPALILIAIFIFLGDEILLLIYGAEYYRAAWPVLIILALGQLACLWAGVSIQALFMTNSQLSVVTVTLLCTFFAIVASLLVVESHGITGVAIVFAIGTSLQSIACVFISRARLGINTSISFRSLFAARNALEALTAVRKRRPETK